MLADDGGKRSPWLRNEQEHQEAKNYLRDSTTLDFFESLVGSMLRHKPKDLPRFSLNFLESFSENCAAPEYDEDGSTSDPSLQINEKIYTFIDSWVLELLHKRPISTNERFKFHKEYLSALLVQD